MSHKSIAIDGPSGAGKSTLARQMAEKLGYLYVDTGAIYRTVGLYIRRKGADPGSAEEVTPLLDEIKISMTYGEDGLQHMLLNGEDVTVAIREHIISDYASRVSVLPQVRAFLLGMQRELARNHSVIMDGRDIGTMVLPDADLKIFLTAAPEARAERRFKELLSRGQEADYEKILCDVIERDERDVNRSVSPLRQAEDAVLLDTTQLDLGQSLQAMLNLAKERLFCE